MKKVKIILIIVISILALIIFLQNTEAVETKLLFIRTNEINITFKGESEVSQIHYAQSPPTFEPVQNVISEARIPLKKPLLKKSLSDFKLFSRA